MSGYYLVRDREAEEGWAADNWSSGSGRQATDWDSVREGMPPPLAGYSEWVETYASGYTLEDVVRWSLGEQGESLTDDQVDSILDSALATMSPEDAENFFRSIGRAFQSALPAIGQIAQVALPIAGGAIGSMFPGVGTAIGGAIGGVAGNLIGQATQRPAATGRVAQAVGQTAGRAVQAAVPRQFVHAGRHLGSAAHSAMAAAAPHLAMAAQGAFTAAAPQVGAAATAAAGPAAGGAVNQLLSLLNDPQLLGALANALLGGMGQAPGGGPAFGQLMGALSQAATEAAAEVYGGYPAESLAAESAEAAEHAKTLVRIIGEAAPRSALT